MVDGHHVAVSDCERVRPGLVAQPVNTISSGAYAVAGAWLARRHRRSAPRLVRPVVAALVLNGAGSVAYHGPGGRRSRWLHDLGVVTLSATLARVALSRHAGRVDRLVARGTVGGGRRPGARWLIGLGLLGTGGVVHTRSRTGGPWCRPDGPFHGHAAWHLLSAAGLALLADAILDEAALDT